MPLLDCGVHLVLVHTLLHRLVLSIKPKPSLLPNVPGFLNATADPGKKKS